MDPDLVRLILIVMGVLLVAGIYFWDRYKRASPRRPMVRPRERREPSSYASTLDDEPGASWNEETGEPDSPSTDAGSDRQPSAGSVKRGLDPDPVDIGDWSGVSAADPQFTMDLNFDAHTDSDYLHADPSLADDVERKLIVLHVVSRGAPLSGSAIARACAAVQLRHGEMSIYHFHDGANGKVLFSMASMVEPGRFPIDEMGNFTTPGLTLFTQLPGARDGLEIFQTMLKVARELASQLQAELQDDGHNRLTGQMEKHLSESIIEHRRRVQLARSRH
jgi:cell division protein ZipA